jgi:hypothetical protein
MDGNRRVMAKLREAYKLYGKPDLVEEYVSKGGHDYRPDLRVAIFGFINQHLKGERGKVKDAEFKPLKGVRLRVFPEDTDVPKDAINGKVDEVFVPLARVNTPEAGQYDRWRKTMMRLLRERSFREFPDRIPAAEEWIKILGTGQTGWVLKTEGDLTADLLNKLVQKPKQDTTALLYVLNPGEEPRLRRGDVPLWVQVLAEGAQVHSLRPRHGWTHKNPPNTVERSHALLGKTVDLGRVRDVAATVRYLDEQAKGKVKWKVVGRGEAGVLAAYAALFEPSISEVVVVDPPASHMDGPTFLNVLRVLDIPEALGMLAPRPLTVVNGGEDLKKRVKLIYKAADADKALRLRSIAFP